MYFQHNFDPGDFVFVETAEGDMSKGVFVKHDDRFDIADPAARVLMCQDRRQYSWGEMRPLQPLLFEAVVRAMDPNPLVDYLMKKDLLSSETFSAIYRRLNHENTGA